MCLDSRHFLLFLFYLNTQDKSTCLTKLPHFLPLVKKYEELRRAMRQSQIPIQRNTVDSLEGSIPFFNARTFTPE